MNPNDSTNNRRGKKPNKNSHRQVVGSVVVSSKNVDSRPSTPSDKIISTAEASAGDLEEKIERLERKLDRQVDKQHNEFRAVILGALLAVVLIVASVAVEVIIFNGDFRSSLDTYEQNQARENQALQTNIQSEQSAINQELLNLKLNP